MPTTSLTIGNELLSTTMHILMKEWRDNIHESTAFLDASERVHGAGQPSQAGGTRIVIPLGFEDHSTTTRLATGYERIDLSVQDVFKPAVYSWAHVVRPVAISSEEEMVNQGDAAVLSILENRVTMTANALKREFVKQIVQGGVAGWEDWGTLNGVDVGTGFLEEAAVGAQANTVGGVDKGAFLTKTGWQNQIFDGAGSFNSNGLAGLYDMKVEIASVSPNGDPNVILASRAGFKNLKRALSAHERYVDQSKIDGGRLVEYWDGVQINVERNMPNAGGTPGTTADPVSFYMLNLNDIHCLWDPKGYFDLSDFETVSGEYDVRAAKIRVRGQLIAKHLGSSGLAFDLETF